MGIYRPKLSVVIIAGVSRLAVAAKGVFLDAVKLTYHLFKIMIPIVIGVKILMELGLIEYLARPLSPVMELVGLPAKTGLVWATAILNNLYSAILVYLALIPDMPPLTVAQITILCTMMLVAHNLPVEARVVQMCGVSLLGQVFLRLGGAIALGVIFNGIFSWWTLFPQPAAVIFQGSAKEVSLPLWAWGEVKHLGAIFCVILSLMTLMRLLDHLRVTALLQRLLKPVLTLIGIGPQAATITIIGLTMGIAYGGGLIIHEARSGELSHRDILASVSLMGLAHALIEDTLLMTLIGASFYGIFWGRLIFALLVMTILVRLWPRKQ